MPPAKQFFTTLAVACSQDAGDLPDVYGKGKVRCELSWSRNLTSGWQRILPGSSLIPHGSTEDLAFDSHMCYAGAHPVKLPNGTISLYYMGADGPHYSWGALKKNCSYGLASLRPDGFVGLRGAKNDTKISNPPVGNVATTAPINCSGPTVLVTADTATKGAAVSIRVHFAGTVLLCEPLQGMDVTDAPLTGCDLTSMVGKDVILEVQLGGAAVLYTFGFGAKPG